MTPTQGVSIERAEILTAAERDAIIEYCAQIADGSWTGEEAAIRIRALGNKCGVQMTDQEKLKMIRAILDGWIEKASWPLDDQLRSLVAILGEEQTQADAALKDRPCG